MTKKIKYINIKEFRTKGYLQEVNRRFLHPLGLALEVTTDKDGNEVINGVWDSRDDLEGIAYGLAEMEDEERLEIFRAKQRHVNQELKKRLEHRKLLFDGLVEQIPKKE